MCLYTSDHSEANLRRLQMVAGERSDTTIKVGKDAHLLNIMNI